MKTKQKKIDNSDRKILSIIGRDARVPLKDVAKVCQMSRAAVHQRVLKMIENGVITGSRYDVNPQAVGYLTCTFVGISLDKGSRYQSVVDQISKIPEIVECHFTTGPYTMLVKLYARDNAHLMELLNHQIQKIVGVTSTETLISLEQSIDKPLTIESDYPPNSKARANELRRTARRSFHIPHNRCEPPYRHKNRVLFRHTSVVDLSPHGTCRFGRGSFCRGHDNKFASRGTFLHRILGYQRTLRTGTAGGARMVSAKPQTPL